MFGNKIKDIHQYNKELNKFLDKVEEFVEHSDTSTHTVEMYTMLYDNARMTSHEVIDASTEILSSHELINLKLRLGAIDLETYEKNIAKKVFDDYMEEIQRVNINDMDHLFTASSEAAEIKYRRALNEINLRFKQVDYIDYEIENSNITKTPYIKVFFSPKKDNTTELEIEIKYNDYFVNILSQREDYEKKYDDEGNIDTTDLLEQWFHTSIIVLAANMLKETDIDFFRSIVSDHPGSELINQLEFDRSLVPEDKLEQYDEIMKNKGIYKWKQLPTWTFIT